MSSANSSFDASAAAIGYLYQLRYALLAALREFGSDASWQVSVEIVDDVEVVSDGTSKRWQLKHRADGTTLTNGSTDLWKTIRIWSEAIRTGVIDPSRTQLLLLTTSAVPSGTAADALQEGPLRNIDSALVLLEKAAAESRSDSNKAGIAAFRRLKDDQKRAMLESVTVLGAAPNIDTVRQELLQICAYAAGQHAEALLERLEGWFVQRCIETMRSRDAIPIPGTDVDEKFSDLRGQFRPDNLPIDDDVLEMTATREQYCDHTFVRQLDLIKIGNARVERAVRDYLRAFTQRSRWVRQNLLVPGELWKYERRLKDEWDVQFDVMKDELGEGAAEERKMAAAKAIYRWAETEFRENIRPECTDAFVCRGSMQILADERKLGWHPDFEARLMAILEPVGGAVDVDG